MICIKYKNRNFFCFKKSIIYAFLYSFIITGILISMDLVYSVFNVHFPFYFTFKEYFYKVFLMVALISMVVKRRVRIGLYLLLLTISFAQYLHFSYFGKSIMAIEFYLLYNNVQETYKALSSMMSMVFAPLIIAIVGFVLIYITDKKLAFKSFKYKYSIHLMLIGFLIYSTNVYYISNIKKGKLTQRESRNIYPVDYRHSTRNFFASFTYFNFGILPKKIFSKKSNFPVLQKPELLTNDSNRTVVLIIGESLRYDTFALYDNKLTPKLQKLNTDSRFFHKKVYSGGTMTKVSISTLINRLKYPEGLTQVLLEDNCLFKLAKENGYNTHFLSAQTSKDLAIIKNMMCPKYIDSLIYRDSFDEYMTPTGFDIDLTTLIDNKQQLINNKNNLIVLQQRGSHIPYKNQYPRNFDRYEPYENTVLYTDTVLYELINLLNKKVKNELFIFFVSDHGELLGENGKNGHGHLEQKVYEVPFFMFTNTKNSELIKPFTSILNHYDISNYIISLLGYKADLSNNHERKLYILNSDFDGFSGYGIIDINNSIESKIKIIR